VVHGDASAPVAMDKYWHSALRTCSTGKRLDQSLQSSLVSRDQFVHLVSV
jgi:hypothetical protein